MEVLFRFVVFLTVLVAVAAAVVMLSPDRAVSRDRESCECRELRAIRMLLEQQSGVICNEWRCLPAPTPTAPSGGPLE